MSEPQKQIKSQALKDLELLKSKGRDALRQEVLKRLEDKSQKSVGNQRFIEDTTNEKAEKLGGEIQRNTSLLIGRMTLSLLVILLFALIQGFNFGFSQSNYTVLIIGSILTILSAFGYGMISVSRAYGSPKQTWMFLASIGGLFPYLFFVYLFFYCGLWSLSELTNGFSFLPIFKAFSFCLLSYYGLNQFYKLTELGKYADKEIVTGEGLDENPRRVKETVKAEEKTSDIGKSLKLDFIRQSVIGKQENELSDTEKENLKNLVNNLSSKDFEEMDKLKSQMTEFDFIVGKLCQSTFRDYNSPDKTIGYGMLEILKGSLMTGAEDINYALKLLGEKSAQSEKSKELCENVNTITQLAGTEDVWSKIKENAFLSETPNIVSFITWLVGTYESRNPRPNFENIKGHYYMLAEFIFAVGLLMSVFNPNISDELINESC